MSYSKHVDFEIETGFIVSHCKSFLRLLTFKLNSQHSSKFTRRCITVGGSSTRLIDKLDLKRHRTMDQRVENEGPTKNG